MASEDWATGGAVFGCGELSCGDTQRSARGGNGYDAPFRDAAMALATLVRAIEGEIVPRLVLARRSPPAGGVTARPVALGAPTTGPVVPGAPETGELTRLLLAHEASVAVAYVESLHERGASFETLCLALLAPAARELGRLWEEDRCDFVAVTLGLCRLHEVLRHLGAVARGVPGRQRGGSGRCVLLVPAPGEQHTFGLLMVAEFFRRGGWEVVVEYPPSEDDLLALVGADRYAVVGLSVGCRDQLDGLSSRIARIRRTSRNREVGVMIGGRLVAEDPALAARLGADVVATDGRLAPRQAEQVARILV